MRKELKDAQRALDKAIEDVAFFSEYLTKLINKAKEEGMSCEQIGKILHITRQRVSQISKR